MKINCIQFSEVDVKTLKLFIKVRDQFACTIADSENQEIGTYEGYVPGFMPGRHYGDYLILDIDLETGQIINWQAPSPEEIEEFVNNLSEE